MIEYANPNQVPPEPRARHWLGRIAAEVGFISLGVVLPIAAGLLVALLSVPTVGVAAIGLMIWMTFLLSRWRLRVRREQALTVLAHVENAVRMSLPLATSLRTWSTTETRATGRMLDRVADALDDGASLGEALRAGAPYVSPRIVDRLITGERNGQLAVAITRVLEDERNRRPVGHDDWPFIRAYLLVMGIVIPLIVSVITIFVMPKYQQIMRDFRTPPPPAMRAMLAVAQGIAPAVGGLALLATMLACGEAAGEFFRKRPPRSSLMIRTLSDRVRWFTPIIGGMDHDRGLADTCRTIADGLEQSRPAPAAVAEAAQSHLNTVLADRIGQWAAALEGGQSLGAGARDARMPRLLVGLLGTTGSTADAVAVLRFLSRYYGGRFSRTAIFLRQAVMPIFALVAGAVVCFVALALFEPMLRLIDKVAPFQVLK